MAGPLNVEKTPSHKNKPAFSD